MGLILDGCSCMAVFIFSLAKKVILTESGGCSEIRFQCVYIHIYQRFVLQRNSSFVAIMLLAIRHTCNLSTNTSSIGIELHYWIAWYTFWCMCDGWHRTQAAAGNGSAMHTQTEYPHTVQWITRATVSKKEAGMEHTKATIRFRFVQSVNYQTPHWRVVVIRESRIVTTEIRFARNTCFSLVSFLPVGRRNFC